MGGPVTTHELLQGRRRGRDVVKPFLLGLIILTAGAAIGASVMFLYLSTPQEHRDREPEIFAERMLGRLARELDLTPEQHSQLTPILREHHKKLSELRASVRPQIVSQLEQMNSDIDDVLTPEQEDIWRNKIQRLEEHFPTFRGRGRGRDGEPDREFGPRGPQGPRQPLGPGYRRFERWPLSSDPNEVPPPNVPLPEPAP